MSQSVLIVTGMHRSGTSLTASWVQALGVSLGDRLFAADVFNQKGYFEDLDFLEFQRSRLQQACDRTDPGWHDWGWTEKETLDVTQFDLYLDEAKALIQQRREQYPGIWGWKDPRTTLMLDFWQRLLPEARYLLVYRLPWDVADSILRLHSPIFSARPDYPLPIWYYYNQRLLDFYRRHPARCVLVNVNALMQHPDKMAHLLASKLGLTVGDRAACDRAKALYDGALFHQLDWQHPLVRAINHAAPRYARLLAELDACADLPSPYRMVDITSPDPALPEEAFAVTLHYQKLEGDRQRQILQATHANEAATLRSQLDTMQQQLEAIEQSKLWRWYGRMKRWLKR